MMNQEEDIANACRMLESRLKDAELIMLVKKTDKEVIQYLGIISGFEWNELGEISIKTEEYLFKEFSSWKLDKGNILIEEHIANIDSKLKELAQELKVAEILGNLPNRSIDIFIDNEIKDNFKGYDFRRYTSYVRAVINLAKKDASPGQKESEYSELISALDKIEDAHYSITDVPIEYSSEELKKLSNLIDTAKKISENLIDSDHKRKKICRIIKESTDIVLSKWQKEYVHLCQEQYQAHSS